MGITKAFEATTKKSLRKQVQEWEKAMKRAGLGIHLGYEPDRVQQIHTGYQILVRAHT